jgi:hypothetical protein
MLMVTSRAIIAKQEIKYKSKELKLRGKEVKR